MNSSIAILFGISMLMSVFYAIAGEWTLDHSVELSSHYSAFAYNFRVTIQQPTLGDRAIPMYIRDCRDVMAVNDFQSFNETTRNLLSTMFCKAPAENSEEAIYEILKNIKTLCDSVNNSTAPEEAKSYNLVGRDLLANYFVKIIKKALEKGIGREPSTRDLEINTFFKTLYEKDSAHPKSLSNDDIKELFKHICGVGPNLMKTSKTEGGSPSGDVVQPGQGSSSARKGKAIAS